MYFTLRYLIHNYLNKNIDAFNNAEHPYAKTSLNYKDKTPLKLAIQGFGNVGSVAALEAYIRQNLQIKSSL